MNRLSVLLTSLILSTSTLTIAAQSESNNTSGIIVTESGETRKASFVEVGGNTVFFQTDPNSPIERIPVAEVMIIKYDNGDKWMPGQETIQKKTAAQNSPAENAPAYVEPIPSPDNANIIKEYNSPSIRYVKNQPNNKYAVTGFVVWNIGEGSVMSDNNVDIIIQLANSKPSNSDDKLVFIGDKYRYQVTVKNKTNKNIYVDLANCFKIWSDGQAEPYFSNSSYTQTNSAAKGASLNLGAVAGALGLGGPIGALASGLNVGGANTSGTQITVTEQRVITIPPQGSVSLPGTKVSNGKNFEEVFENFEIGEYKGVTAEALDIKQWTTRDFSESNSPVTMSRLVTYSTDPEFSTYTTLPIKLYVGEIIGGAGIRFIGPYPEPNEVEGTAKIYTLEKFKKK